VTLEQAISLLRQPRLRGRGAARQTTLKDFGANPATGKQAKLLSGRYGPYVTDGEVNATVPRGTDPMSLTAEDAFRLLTERAAQIAEQGGIVKRPAVKRPAVKKPARKAAVKTSAKPAKNAAKKAAKKSAKKAAKKSARPRQPATTQSSPS
jgi:DNA topoisomerase-1